MVAGMFEVLLGCLLFFVVAIMGATLAPCRREGVALWDSSPNILIKALVMDVLMAVVLIWVGIGLGTAGRGHGH